ncbi:SUKH-3 domain-containing protein [Streptomyces sp. NPDC004111]|uniref:SUKH-3 domain-containing protein n=1 Tax=Streptomyces sp. NPDC004111 TaxID=3364690 RepID=UPI0036BD718C
MEFPSDVEKVLKRSGWREGRRVQIGGWRDFYANRGIHMHPAAQSFLSEFGGLRVPVRGPGVTAARVPFELNPLLVDGDEDRFPEWSEEADVLLYPVGQIEERYPLGIDESSRLYIVSDWLARFRPMPEAMEDLILGFEAENIY